MSAVGLVGLAFLPEYLPNHFVGIMWPGTISVASGKMPLGGTGLFALLAMGGDLGASIGLGVVGTVTQRANDNMKAGMLAGCIFPIVLIASLCFMKTFIAKKKV